MEENINNENFIEEAKKKLSFYFRKIENYLKEKENYILTFKHIPLEEIFRKAPKYYYLIALIERFNTFLSKDSDWLKNFVLNNNIKFDFDSYNRWKAGKKYENYNYNDTQSPSKWIHIIQEYLIELLEYIQILLVMECYINDADYKLFLKKNPRVFLKLKANFKSPSPPSENLDLFFEILDMILNITIANNLPTNPIVDTTLCLRVYRKIDQSGLFDILKRKEFYVRYRLEYLKNTEDIKGMEILYSDNTIKIAEKFLEKSMDFRLSYNEYKEKLIQKQQRFMRKNK